jgi:uncharacterized protein (UPF0261 family)
MATVVLVGTLDTKGAEYAFVKQCIKDAGLDCIVINTGILGEPPFEPEISASMVAEAAGKNLNDIRFAKEGSDTRAVAIDTMSRGLDIVLKKLLDENKCDAVFGMGGSGGTNLISAAMKKLPLGVPKLLLSTMMSGDVRPYVGSTDMAMMYSVTDIAGLNMFSRMILANAAHAVAGMAMFREEARAKAHGDKKPLVGITMFGITTPGVLHMVDLLEKKGFETIVFHATGSGGQAMENMIREGLIDGVIDYTLSELCDYEFGGAFSAGPDRLTAASDMGIPQVIVPGAIEVLNYNGVDNLPPDKNIPERKLIIHNPTVCAVKTTNEELKLLGRIVGEKVSRARDKAHVLLPLGGLDKYEAKGGPWEDAESDRVLFDAIKTSLSPHIPVQEIDANINDAVFAEAAVETFLKLWKKDEVK